MPLERERRRAKSQAIFPHNYAVDARLVIRIENLRVGESREREIRISAVGKLH